jgi:hypothetical protein
MHIRTFIRYVLRYAKRRHIDWTLERGDLVMSHGWPKPIEIVDINWALWTAAVQLSPGAIVVWPLWSLRRV